MTEWLQKAKDWLQYRAHAYRQTFTGPLGIVVARDLAKFCRAHESTGHKDPYIAARLDGRREVWLRIQQHLRLTDEELWKVFNEKRGGQ